ncbi:MAG: hypothetical protein AB1439_03170 [candidate division FCPU426 bacterium]
MRWFFPLLPLVGFYLAGSPALALQGFRLVITDHAPDSVITADRAPVPASLQPAAGERLVIGRLENAGLRLPTLNHMALYDRQGRTLPLAVERASLRWSGDKITGLTLAFQVPETATAGQTFDLVWSEEYEPLSENTEVPAFHLDDPALRACLSFRVQPVSKGAMPTAMLVEVDVRRAWYQWWYLFPLVTAVLLGWLFLRTQPKERP